jgi:tetratricopeptide (TPR) repeat protein
MATEPEHDVVASALLAAGDGPKGALTVSPPPCSVGAGARRWQRLLVYPARRPGRFTALVVVLALLGLAATIVGRSLLAIYHFHVGKSALERYHPIEARTHLEDSLRLWPDDPASLLLLGRASRRLGAFEDAQQYLDQCNRLARRDGPLADELALERVLLQAHRGEVDAVGAVCESFVRQNHPGTPLILEALADGFIRQVRLGDAQLCVREWLKRQPENPQAHFLQARLYDTFGGLRDAASSFRHVVELDAERDDARLELAGLLVTLAQPSEAAPHAAYLASQHPRNVRVRVLLAQCREALGQPEEAVRLLDEVLAQEPHFGPALAERGRLALADGQAAEAEGMLQEACLLQPGDARALYQLELCFTRQGKTDAARECSARMKQLEDDHRQLREVLGRRMQENPHDPALHYQMGMIVWRAGAVGEAVKWFENALRYDPDHAPSHEALAKYYRLAGNMGRSARHRDLAEKARSKSAEPASSVPATPVKS